MLAPSGKWIWKDETNTLEFISQANQYTEKGDKKKRKGHQDATSKRNEKNTSSLGNRSYYSSRPNMRSITRSPKPPMKCASDAVFTLDDIKNRTLELFAEINPIADAFMDLFPTEQFNEFLLYLLNYFHYFFLKCDMDGKPKDQYIQQGLMEIKKYTELCSRVNIAQKLLGQAYSVLVMGLGMDSMHHMSCGTSRVSYTLKDRSMFETFYSYCSLLVWINFKRKDRPTVRKEIGRILRSDTFNPAIRVKKAPVVIQRLSVLGEQEDKLAGQEHEVILSPAEYRRVHGKRPAITTIIHQRSPAIVSIVPSPKEETPDLFVRNALQETNPRNFDIEDEIESQLKEELKHLKVGILGDFQNLYNPQNLMALSEDKDENENDNAAQPEVIPDESIPSDGSPSKSLPSPEKVSRQLTAISQATTEAFIEETDN